MQGVVQSAAAKSGKGAVQAAVQAAVQGAVHYCTYAGISENNSHGIKKKNVSLKPFFVWGLCLCNFEHPAPCEVKLSQNSQHLSENCTELAQWTQFAS